MRLRVLFRDDGSGVGISRALKSAVKDAAKKTLASENFTLPVELSVTFTNNEGIRALNRDYRAKDAPTDVLSFPMYSMKDGDVPESGETVTLGDIVLSLEKAAEQAEQIGNSFLREVSFLTVHSVLHLLGYDHETSPEDERDMFDRQKRIMETIKTK